MMTSSRISPIQRGTSRPLGKSRKNAKREVRPRKLTRLKGKEKTGEESASTKVGLPDEGVVEDITRKKAASSASQSSDLRQKMMKPTAHQIAAMITEKMVNKAAYPLADKPVVESVCSPCAGSAPKSLPHAVPIKHAVWSC